MGFREQLCDEEREISHLKSIGILAEHSITAKQIDAASAGTFIRLAESGARGAALWRRRIESKVGIELQKICEQFEQYSVGDNQMIDCVLSACINSRSRKCYLCKMKDKRNRKHNTIWNARFDHSSQCQSWAASIIAHRALSRVHSPHYLDSCRRALKKAYDIFVKQSRMCLSLLGGDVLPDNICKNIVRQAVLDDLTPVKHKGLKQIGVAIYLVYESLIRMLAGDREEPAGMSPLSFISRLHFLTTSMNNFLSNPSRIRLQQPWSDCQVVPCAYVWPWVPIKRGNDLIIENVETMESIQLQSENTGLFSFCVTDDFVVTIENHSRRLPRYFETVSVSDSGLNDTDGESSSTSSISDKVSLMNIFSLTGAFLYSVALNELEYDYDTDDEPVRLFRHKQNVILVVIERENSLIPCIHQEKGVISLAIDGEKGKTRSFLLDDDFGRGGLLEFLKSEKASLSIWHPVCTAGAPLKGKKECYDLSCYDDENIQKTHCIISPINSEIVQIKSDQGHVTRAVSPRVKPRSYRQYRSSISTSRFYMINELVTHFCEISHAGRLLRVSSSNGKLLLELNADTLLYWEKQDSRILASDCYWPHLLLVIEYEESFWAIDTEETVAFQTVIYATIDSGSLSDIKVLDVSRNDPQSVCGECAALDTLVPNRVPDGGSAAQLPVRLSANHATIVYPDNTIAIHDLNFLAI